MLIPLLLGAGFLTLLLSQTIRAPGSGGAGSPSLPPAPPSPGDSETPTCSAHNRHLIQRGIDELKTNVSHPRKSIMDRAIAAAKACGLTQTARRFERAMDVASTSLESPTPKGSETQSKPPPKKPTIPLPDPKNWIPMRKAGEKVSGVPEGISEGQWQRWLQSAHADMSAFIPKVKARFSNYLGKNIFVPGAGMLPVTLSGVLGVINRAGMRGAVQWFGSQEDKQKHPNTTKAFIDTTGIF